MKRQCSNCRFWIPTIDNGFCEKEISKRCELDDTCNKYKPKLLLDKIGIDSVEFAGISLTIVVIVLILYGAGLI
ncbi:hypothetical protein [Clostridium botulinum]|uniref:hypothetical protein n=1 Tax=Clostridium botulinum TaxID=1491 RepID=UPI0013F0EF95|nr:hypothetical protein [Clostridium botulinum]EGT5649367.1 hypothetical protein [Clostridium botulinum]MBY6755485.1 hypothetical protein [Clostridium botulinum]MBY6766412.1 hypothetical protein [Clostridium botulinum]MBY6900494.1 hypothetical protein [Clostridium botulinum]MBY6914617.1 hypothetical protein [Clostridium botulinum]